MIVYIDGYNLYYGMRAAFGSRYKWLDLQAFSESLLKPSSVLVAVKYFTAMTKSTTEASQRQSIYLKALAHHCNKLEIYQGSFLSKSKHCPHCHTAYRSFEEKQTDVNIACHILNDAYLDHYDGCYVVSGDSDLVPPLRMVKEYHPGKWVIIAHPPQRKGAELCKTGDNSFAISKQQLRNSQLPSTLITPRGSKLTRPPGWKS